jgi:HAD superfamily hydrolase (TIGR01509 family)
MQPAVIFDLDGVLIDSEELHYRAYCEILEPEGVSIDRTVYGREWISAGHGPEWVCATYPLPFSGDELKKRKGPIYRSLLESELAAMPGAADALTRLSRDFPLAVATNSGREDVEYVLKRLGLREFLADVVTRERYERAKPAPDAFLAAAAALGRPCDRCLVVEDSLRGLRAAVAAQIACVAVPNEFTRDSDLSAAIRILPSLDALEPELVHELLAESGR